MERRSVKIVKRFLGGKTQLVYMARRKWKTLSPDSIIEQIKKAGFSEANRLAITPNEGEKLLDIGERVKTIINIAQNSKNGNMVYFVMYDIENDKVRALVSKYLISQGCIRIQNSVFMADTPKERFETIKNDLSEVQAAYENNDSIVVVPISSMNIEAMHIIGKNLDIDMVKGKGSRRYQIRRLGT